MKKGFFEVGDGVFTGKGLSAVLASKRGRNDLIMMFGADNLPSSVMRAKRIAPTQDDDECGKDRGYNATAPGLEKSRDRKIPKELRDAFQISGRGCGAGALSRFPQNIGRSVVLLYSEPGDTVFDPFAGHNSRLDLTVKAGRHYIGCDLSTEFMAFNFKRAEKLREMYPEARIKLHHCDSRKVPVEDEIGDMTLTSPPYWDIEYYGDEPEQLGKRTTYEGFLKGLKKVMRENHRVLKPGKFAVWFINDFRKKGVFYSYHSDVIRLGREVGFVHHDLLVVDLGNSIRDCFINQTVEQKILPKRHEFGVVFRKPD